MQIDEAHPTSSYFSKIEFYFEEVVQNFELTRVGGAPKSHPCAPLTLTISARAPDLFVLKKL